MVDWSYFDRFEFVSGKFLPNNGEGQTRATQIVTAVNKLVYKWYNDGDVYDNTYLLDGWCNDLSSYANWLYGQCDKKVQDILMRITEVHSGAEYSELLKDLADTLLDLEDLENWNKLPKVGSIYECDGPFVFNEEVYDDEEDEWYY